MADNSKIEWTDATWNPVTGCSVVSPGCTNCYAAKLAGTRLRNHSSRAGLTAMSKAGPVWNGVVRFNEQWLTQPLQWKRSRRIFVCAHGDLFHENVPDEWIDKVFAVMALAPQHTFQVLTKRSVRMREYLTRPSGDGKQDVRNYLAFVATPEVLDSWCPDWKREDIDGPHRSRGIAAFCEWPLPNVWLGVSTEDQQRADERIPDLLATPAAVRFISAEPLLGPIDLFNLRPDGGHLNALTGVATEAPAVIGSASLRGARLDLVIVGGESGNGARPMHPDWARSPRDQCDAANVPFLFKQWGVWAPVAFDGCYSEADGSGAPDVAWPDGSISWGKAEDHGGLGTPLRNLGKKAAGRLLDAVEHNGMPG